MADGLPVKPAGTLRFRDAKLADAAAVAALIEALGYPCELGEAERRIRRVNASPRQAMILAEHEGQVRGLIALDYMFYLPLGRDTCRITALVVDAGARHLGIGRALLRHAESLARKENVARIELTTAGHRHEAHSFYLHCGYERSSVRFVKPLGDA